MDQFVEQSQAQGPWGQRLGFEAVSTAGTWDRDFEATVWSLGSEMCPASVRAHTAHAGAGRWGAVDRHVVGGKVGIWALCLSR